MKYLGSELELFSAARNWKSYWSAQIRPFLKGDVLEVGAGIGSNTPFMISGTTGRWVCLDPDPEHASRLTQMLEDESCIRRYEVVCGTLESTGDQEFDSIVYIDVLEHIERDAEELRRAARHLRPGGHVIALAPAHQRLFTAFDANIGHLRRYDKASISRITPPELRLMQLRYLDSAGLAASAANLLLLRQSMPTASQLRFWDRWMVPVSRIADILFGYAVGKSILAIWYKA